MTPSPEWQQEQATPKFELQERALEADKFWETLQQIQNHLDNKPENADELSHILDKAFNEALNSFWKEGNNKDTLNSLNNTVNKALSSEILTEEDKQTLEDLKELLEPFTIEKAVENKTETYTVKPWDTLSKIAKEKWITLSQIKDLNSDLFKNWKDSKWKNRRPDWGLIYPGDVIKIKAEVWPKPIEPVVEPKPIDETVVEPKPIDETVVEPKSIIEPKPTIENIKTKPTIKKTSENLPPEEKVKFDQAPDFQREEISWWAKGFKYAKIDNQLFARYDSTDWNIQFNKLNMNTGKWEIIDKNPLPVTVNITEKNLGNWWKQKEITINLEQNNWWLTKIYANKISNPNNEDEQISIKFEGDKKIIDTVKTANLNNKKILAQTENSITLEADQTDEEIKQFFESDESKIALFASTTNNMLVNGLDSFINNPPMTEWTQIDRWNISYKFENIETNLTYKDQSKWFSLDNINWTWTVVVTEKNSQKEPLKIQINNWKIINNQIEDNKNNINNPYDHTDKVDYFAETKQEDGPTNKVSEINKTIDNNLENKNIKEALENGLKSKWYEIKYNNYWDIIFTNKNPNKNSISSSSEDMSFAKDKANSELIEQVKQLTWNNNIVEQFKHHVILNEWQMYRDKNEQYTYVVNSWRIGKFLLDKLNKTA